MHRYASIAGLVIASILFFCSIPQNPRNPSNAKIAGQTIENIPDEIPVASSFPCSVSVLYPEFIDSFAVVVAVDEQEGEKVAGGTIDDDTLYQFDLMFPDPGEYTTTLYLYRNNSVIDSFTSTITVLPLVSGETVSDIPDSIPIKFFFPCTISIRYPDSVDSIAVLRSDENGEYSRMVYAGAVDEEDVGFDISFPDTGLQVVAVLLYCESYVDTVADTSYVFSTLPVAAVVEPVKYSYLNDSLILEFTASDPDSNLLSYQLTSAGGISEEVQLLAGERFEASIEKVLSLSYLVSLPDTVDLISLSVMDEDSQASPVVVCTLTIVDTVPPELVPEVASLFDTIQTVASLPDSLLFSVDDNWHVDSVTFDGQIMAIDDNGKVVVKLIQLDSGLTEHTINVWDRAGNKTERMVELYYSGPKVYPPIIASILQTINEGELFDTVFLDDKVTITDPDPEYTKDSLEWSIVTDSIDSGMVVHFDAIAHTLYVQAPAGEIYRNRVATMAVTVTDPLEVSRTQNSVTFLMVEQDDPPNITIKGQSRQFGVSFDTLKLDTCGFDPEGVGALSWTIEKGRYFYPDSIYSLKCITKGTNPICLSMFTGKVAIVADTAKTKNLAIGTTIRDTLQFTLKSTTATVTTSTSKKIPFTWNGLQIIIPPIDLELDL